MKAAILSKLVAFETEMRGLKKSVAALRGDRVSSVDLREKAEKLASVWVEELRSPLEHKFGLPAATIQEMAEHVKRLHVLSRPNNRKTSYIATLSACLSGFKNRFILPIQQSASKVESVFDLQKIVAGLSNKDESGYLQEAIDCANNSYKRAAMVMGWCAAIDRIQKKVTAVGFDKFSKMSTSMKAQTTGKFKHYNKEFKITNLSELQRVFDTDLIMVCEALGLLDGNQADRLIQVDFQFRNHSAHPGEAPIEDPHLVAFFTDINDIILTNPRFAV